MKNADLAPLLEQSPLFSLLEPAIVERLLDHFEMRSYELGETIITKGDAADSIYVIYSGKARVVGSTPDGGEVTLATLTRGAFFGERALLADETRGATIRAATEVVAARLAKADFRAVAAANGNLEQYLKDYTAQQALFNLLRQFTIFSALSAKEVRAWLDRLQHEELTAGAYVFREGDVGDRFYIVVSGKADVIRVEANEERVVNTLREGQFFGELALLSNKPRRASIRAREDLHLVSLSKDHFNQLVNASPKLREMIFNVVALYNLDKGVEDLGFSVPTHGDVAPAQAPTEKPVAPAEPAGPEAPYRPRRPWRRRLFGLVARRARYPFIEQYDQTDCGAASMAMILKFYGKKVSVTRLRDMANVSTEGATMMSVALAAESLGFNTRAIRASYDALLKVRLPAIVHWDGYHYIVLWELTARRAVVGDPGRGLVTYTRKEFSERWTGFALLFEPTPRLESVQQAKTSLSRFVGYVKPQIPLLVEILACSLLVSLFGLAPPIFTQVIVDNVVVHHNVALLNTVLIGMLCITVLTILAGTLRTYLTVHLSNKMRMMMLGDFYRQVLSLPMKYFEVRKVGDILSRFEENEKIKELMTGTTLSLFLDVVMLIVYMAVIFAYSSQLGLLVLLFLPFFAAITIGFTPAYQRTSRLGFEKEAATQSHMVESITGVKTLKSSTAELWNRWKYEGFLAGTLKAGFRFAKLDMTAESGAHFLQTLSTVVFLYFGANQVIKGELSIGQLMAFMGLVGHVIDPVQKLVGQWNEIQEALIAVERLNDVFDVPPEEKLGDESLVQMPPIRGHVKFENVSFAYARSEKMILRNVTFEARPGQAIAIIGRSGSGKTTLMNLLMRFYEPTEGRITIDGIDIRNVTVGSLRRQIGMVLQENYLFSGTIRENITLGAPDKPFTAVVEAATLAAAHDFISELPMAYKSDVGERGSSLSGGQRQRIAIARALLRDPRILIFDEATSALDNESEKAIQKSLGAITRDRTTFAIAHRLSTIQNSDLIIVLDQGVVVETGTHHELMDRRGLYYYLNSLSLDLT
jgi:ATP-binding cassette subfamily B protein